LQRAELEMTVNARFGRRQFSCCGHDSLRENWYMLYGAWMQNPNLLLISFLHAILFIDRNFITPSVEQRSQQS
jgi:hypothetical protein